MKIGRGGGMNSKMSQIYPSSEEARAHLQYLNRGKALWLSSRDPSLERTNQSAKLYKPLGTCLTSKKAERLRLRQLINNLTVSAHPWPLQDLPH